MLLDKTPEHYPGWKLYHPQEAFMEGSKTVLQIRAIEGHFRSNPIIYDSSVIIKTLSFPLHIQTLENDEKFMREWQNFKQDLQDTPEQTLACCGLAMHQIILGSNIIDKTNMNLKTIKPRIYGYGPVTNLRSLKVNSYGKMVTINGTIVRVGGSYTSNTWMAYKCGTCDTQQAIKQPDGIGTVPTSCRDGCRARSNFIPIVSSPFTKIEAIQEIRLQEGKSFDNYDSGRVPQNIEVELKAELVDSVCPGDDVTITGILKVRSQDEFTRRDQANMYKMYLECITILNNKNSINTRRAEYTDKDLEAIGIIKSEPSVFRLLVQSLCPHIYGHEMVKAGLILGLFGGSGNSKSGRRTETHVLVVGDPGVGKTQMLQSCANISPRGIFICGKSSTSAGLTVSVRHEKKVGNSLEAGALILADQGACCIDEFDKMTSNQQPLLEVMEQQMVSVAKAGVLCTLPARTSILAAANPSGGHYDKSKTVSENLKIGPALLSRFDLVFIVLDRPNEYHDKLLTKHIQWLHEKNKSKLGTSSSKFLGSGTQSTNTGDDNDIPLYERLKLKPNEQMDLLPHVLMQKYIGYSRKNFNPKLTSDAAKELKNFYLELRQLKNDDSIPVTIRQLESLVRLTQARARVDLSQLATIEHAHDVLSIFRQSMIDVFSTDAGDFHMQRGINGSGMSQASQIKKYLKLLERHSQRLQKTIFSVDELREIAQQGGFTINFLNLLETLNIQGFMLKKGLNLYKLLID